MCLFVHMTLFGENGRVFVYEVVSFFCTQYWTWIGDGVGGVFVGLPSARQSTHVV